MNEHVTIDGEVLDDRAARVAFNRAMAKAQAVIPLVPKTATAQIASNNGKSYTYHYATLASVVEAVRGPLNANGIWFNWRAEAAGDLMRVTCVLRHEEGFEEAVSQVGPIPPGGNRLQSIGSCQSYLQRYTLALATGVATVEDTDGNGSGGAPEPAPRKAVNVQPLVDKIRAARTADEVRALKPEIDEVPTQTPERTYVAKEVREALARLTTEVGDA